MPEDIGAVLDERGSSYGDFGDLSHIAQSMKDVMREGRGWHSVGAAPPLREAAEMICTKLARLTNGGMQHADSWVDIIGYATLALGEIDHGQ